MHISKWVCTNDECLARTRCNCCEAHEIANQKSDQINVLNSLLHISINGPAVKSEEADNIVLRVLEKYINQVHYKVPKEFNEATLRIATTSSTQTLPETTLKIQESVEIAHAIDDNILNEEKEEYLTTNMEISD